jgi:hypothetical protein
VEREEDGQLGDAMERDQSGRPHSGTVEMLAVGPSVAAENIGAARRSASTQDAVIFFMENGNNRATVRELRTRGYDYLLGWCCSPRTKVFEGSDVLAVAFPFVDSPFHIIYSRHAGIFVSNK